MGMGDAKCVKELEPALFTARAAHALVNRSALLLAAMRIDPKASIRGVPVLRLRKLVRALNDCLSWDLGTIREALSVTPLEAAHMLRALEAAGLARPLRRKGSATWTTTSRAQAFASATA